MSRDTPHILIIGAGLIGLSTADALMAQGADVTLLDARSGPVRGASFSNSGMLHPSQARAWSGDNDMEQKSVAAVFELATESVSLIQSRMEELQLISSADRPVGCYKIFETDRAADQAKAQYERDGIPSNRVRHAERTFDKPGIYFPGDRSADAKLYGEALAYDLETRGATFIYEADDVRLSQHDGRAAAFLGSHRFRVDHVILAGGAQSTQLTEPLGLDLPIVPVRGWAVDFKTPADLDVTPIPVMDAKSLSAFTPFENRFRLSGTWDEPSAKPLLRRWAEIIPNVIADAGKPLAVWSGFRPVSTLGRPFIGPTDIAGLWLNVGHGHMGWTLCAGSGALLADMMLNNETVDQFAFRPS